MKRIGYLLTIALMGCHAEIRPDTTATVRLDEPLSGQVFLTPETRALQKDTFANPGYLWVDNGKALFAEASRNGRACQSCHEAGLVGAAATFPKLHTKTGQLFNLESQINYCRTSYQEEAALPYESESLLGLTAFVANQSVGLTRPLDEDERLSTYVEQGRRYFTTRRGQFNLSCAQCHDHNWGQRLRGDTISQGHTNGFPTYRLEWQTLGSLQRRLQDCDIGIRADALDLGHETYIAVELYLAQRGANLPLESPAIRR